MRQHIAERVRSRMEVLQIWMTLVSWVVLDELSWHICDYLFSIDALEAAARNNADMLKKMHMQHQYAAMMNAMQGIFLCIHFFIRFYNRTSYTCFFFRSFIVKAHQVMLRDSIAILNACLAFKACSTFFVRSLIMTAFCKDQFSAVAELYESHHCRISKGFTTTKFYWIMHKCHSNSLTFNQLRVSCCASFLGISHSLSTCTYSVI